MCVISFQATMGLERSNILNFWCRITALLVLIVHSSFALNTDGIFLLSFKYSVLSDPNTVLQTWNYDDETPCSWTGVTCTQLGIPGTPDMFRVTSLILPNSQLLGSISPDIGSIQHLQHLDLSNNFFNGSLPLSLFNSSELQVLSLSNNVISGELPDSIGELKMLQFLNLSHNALAGKVPQTLTTITNLSVISLKNNYFWDDVPSGFKFVQVLDLSSNLLNGSMPLDFDGGNLRYLNLSYNKFSGKIPPEFAKAIPGNATIDISFNNLTGAIPESIALLNQKTEAFSGNLDLCGKPLKKLCSIPSTLSTPPNVTSTSSPAIAAIPRTIDSTPLRNSPETSTGTKQQTHSGLKPSTIAAITVGDLAGIGILAIIGLYIYQLRKKKRDSINSPTMKKLEENAYVNEPINPESKSLPIWSSCLTIKGGGEETSESTSSGSDNEFHPDTNNVVHGTEDVKKRGSIVCVDGETEIELETLLKASAYVLGASGTSIVYKAVLEDGTALAVRRIGEGCVEKLRDFENQVRLVAKLRHPNLVKVRGFYWGSDEKLVIYDYVNNGSLAGAGKLGSSPCHLPLTARLKIARGVARALTYIHEKKYVHGNIKPSNILLDSNMEPLISDLGRDRLVRDGQIDNNKSVIACDGLQELPTTSNSPYRVTGGASMAVTSPYDAPESLKNPKPNPKWDVYSFGIVLLELLTGKVYLDQELAEWIAGPVMKDKNRVLRLADVAIRAEVEAREDAVLACFKLGFSCASLVIQKRPSMKEALQVLEKIPLT